MDEWKRASGPFWELTAAWRELSEELPYVSAFWIHGSRAAGAETKTSDIDYAFLVERRDNEHPLYRQLKKSLDVDTIHSWYAEGTWEVARWRKRRLGFSNFVSPHIYARRSVLSMARNLFSMRPVRRPNAPWIAPIQTTYFLRHQGTAQSLINESVPVYDPDGYLPRLRESLSRYPDSLSKRLVGEFVQRLRIKLKWYTNQWIPTNKASFVLAIQDILYFIAAAHYAKNKRLMRTLGLTRYHRDLPTLKPDLRRDLNLFLAIDDEFGHQNKSAPLKRIVERLAT